MKSGEIWRMLKKFYNKWPAVILFRFIYKKYKSRKHFNQKGVEQVVAKSGVSFKNNYNLNADKKFDKKTFIFDVDGTLVNKKGELQPYVVELFKNIFQNVENPKLMFLSGGSVAKIQNVVQDIKKQSGLDFKSMSAGYAGGLIVDENDNVIFNKPLVKENMESIKKLAYGIDESLVIFGCTENGNYYIKPNVISKQNAVISAFKINQAKNGKTAFNAKGISREEWYAKLDNGEIMSLEMLTLSKEKNKDITKKAIINMAGLENTFVCAGRTIQVTSNTKWFAAEFALGNEDDFYNAVYFGDGYNDIECLRKFTNSFAVGDIPQVLKAGKYCSEDLGLATRVLFAENQEKIAQSASEKRLKQIEEEQFRKEQKKGRVKKAITSFFNKEEKTM